MIVVDSSVWISNMRDLGTDAARRLQTELDPNEIVVGDIVMLELLQGARDDAHAARIERELREFQI